MWIYLAQYTIKIKLNNKVINYESFKIQHMETSDNIDAR